MAAMHRLLLTLASSSALYSSLVPALGLGGITLHSALNQPLEAEIQLVEVGDLSADEVRVRLGSEADFIRSGVERIFFLNDLRFTPLFKGNRSVIRVTSNKPIREPYLNFVVALARPSGQLVREYTLLIDPPSSSAYRRVAELPSYTQPVTSNARSVKPVTQARVAIQGNSYRVVAGDSLWLIAKRVLASQTQGSQQTLMDDIQALNPQAFVAGDSSRLRLGVTLNLPDRIAAPVAEVSPASALSSVDAPSTPPLGEPSAVLETVPNAAINRPGTSADIALAQSRVDAELAVRAEENRQLQASMLALQAQLTALQEQVQAKDQQLELLRADLALNRQAQMQAGSIASPVAASVPPVVVAATSEQQSVWWWLLGGVGALLSVLAALFWRARGRSRDIAAVEVRPPVIRATAVKPAPLPATVAVAPMVANSASAPAVAPLASPPHPVAAAPRPASPTADALEGANIYIAYGRFSEALGVLRKGVEAEPQRLELRLRMLEVLGELGDSAGFAQEEAILRQQGADAAQLNQLWTRFAHVLVAEPQIILDEAVLHLDEPPLSASAPNTVAVDDFQLNLEDLSLDADWDSLSPFKTATATRTKTALSPVANNPAFGSNLQQLPEVTEVHLEQHALSPFADWPVAQAVPEQVVETELIDAFAGESRRHLAKPVLASLDHLASNRENLVKLNKALAYIAQGNLGSACNILNQVIIEGDAQQQQQARELLAKIA